MRFDEYRQVRVDREHTLSELRDNLERVRSLVKIYDAVRISGGGRKPVVATDVLRAATVFLHSSVEEVFRNLFVWKLHTASEEVLNDIPLIGTAQGGRPEKFFLGKLKKHEGLFVGNLIR